MLNRIAICSLLLLTVSSRTAFADDTFDKLISQGKFKEAADYADNNIPAPSRTADVWVKLGQANEGLGLTEKALACYLVSWRMNAADYGSLLGAAKIYNKLGQPENAMNMAKKALEQKFTGEASWEYARACIALNKAAEAKKALEKVIETDAGNVVANRELGVIYYNDKEYQKAIPLLKKALATKRDAETLLAIGKSYKEMGVWDSALAYIEAAIGAGLKDPDVALDLGRVYFERGNYKGAVEKLDQTQNSSKFTARDQYNRAVAKEKTGDTNGAMDAYGRAVSAYGSAKDKEAVDARLKVGKDALNSKRYTAAISQFEFIASADPSGALVPNINLLLADAYLGAKETPKAIAALEKAIGRDNRNYKAFAQLADLYEKTGNPEKAKRTYESMMTLSPNDPKVYIVLGQYNLRAKKYNEALDLFSRGNAIKSTAEAEEGIAVAALALSQWNKAREAATSAIAKDNSLIESRKILAQIYMRSREYRDAKEPLEFLVAREPNNMEYWKQLAECYESLNDAAALSKADEKIVAADPKNVKSRVRLAQFRMTNKANDAAVILYKEVVALDPANVEATRNLYKLTKSNQDKSEAVSWLKEYLSLNASDAERRKELGDLLYERKDFDGALDAYRMVIKLNPSIKGFYKRYADIVLKKNLQNEVIKAFGVLIESGDADVSTYSTLGMIYENQKLYQKALDIYQKALVLWPQNAELLSSFASCQASTGDVNGAVITYEQAVMLNPESADDYKALGDLYARLKSTEQSMKAYMKYLDKKPNDEAVAKNVGGYAYSRKMYEQAVQYLGMAKGEMSTNADVMLMYGKSAFSLNKCDLAVPVFENIRRNAKAAKPALTEATGMLAECYEKQGKNIDAAKTYAAYVQLVGPTDADAAYKSAVLQEKVNPADAQKIYENNVKVFTRDYRNYVKLGLIYAQNKATLSQSIPMLKKAAQLADTIPAVWLELASVHGKLGNDDEELNAYKQYIKFQPQDLQANKRLGILLMAKGKTTESMVYLETANAVSGNDADVMAALAEGYIKTKRDKEAVDLMMKVKALKGSDPEIRWKIFELQRKLGRIKEAEQEIKELIAIKRDNKYMQAYAQMMIEAGKTREAENAVEDILATDAENLSALMLKATLQRAQKKYNDAVETYKEISYIDPNNVEALYERAETYMNMSKPQWAETFYQRALRIDANHALSMLGMAKLAKTRKDQAKYMEYLQKAYSLNPNDKQIQDEYRSAKK